QAISPTPETLAALVARGVHSAQSVAQIPRGHFVHQLSQEVDPAVAAQTHENALRAQARNEQALAAIHQMMVGTGIALVDGATTRADRLQAVQQAADRAKTSLDVTG